MLVCLEIETLLLTFQLDYLVIVRVAVLQIILSSYITRPASAGHRVVPTDDPDVTFK